MNAALLPLFSLNASKYERTLADGTRLSRVYKLFDRSSYQIDKARFITGLDGEYRSYFKFTFVRNRLGRFASLYSQKFVGKGRRPDTAPDMNPLGVEQRFYLQMPFAEFVEAVYATPDEEANSHFRPQHLVVCRQGPKRRVMADFVGRFENLHEDFVRVAERIGAPPPRAPPSPALAKQGVASLRRLLRRPARKARPGTFPRRHRDLRLLVLAVLRQPASRLFAVSQGFQSGGEAALLFGWGLTVDVV